MNQGKSSLAIQADGQRRIVPRKAPIWGVCIHTTGSGVPSKAAKLGKDPVDVAVGIYLSGPRPFGPAYVIGWEGEIVQVADELSRTEHVGGLDRDEYLSGTWVKQCHPAAVELWRRRWPQYESPQHLFPSRYPNTDLVGCELIPVLGGKPKPAGPGLRFTEKQHQAIADLCRDIAKRHSLPAGWANTSRLVGHEDVGLLDRHDKGGGWDPGALRERPYFDFEWVRRTITRAECQ